MTEVRTPSNDFVPGSWIIFMSYTESKQKSKREECENESMGVISYKKQCQQYYQMKDNGVMGRKQFSCIAEGAVGVV